MNRQIDRRTLLGSGMGAFGTAAVGPLARAAEDASGNRRTRPFSLGVGKWCDG